MRIRFVLSAILLSFTLGLYAQESNFKPGALTAAVVSKDAAKTIDFYTKVIGMQKVGAFKIDSVFAKRLGLSGVKPFKVTRLAFDATPESAQLKIVSFDAEVTSAAKPVTPSIQGRLGLQYLTLQVVSLDEILKQAQKEGVVPEADTPIKLGDHSYLVLLRDPDGVFVEIIGDYSYAD